MEIVKLASRSQAFVQNRCEEVGCVMNGRAGSSYLASFPISSLTAAAGSGKKPSLTTIS
jgi:hypothetical protein